ncbi:transposase-associated domain-containing protein [Tanacetum coccineum]
MDRSWMYLAPRASAQYVKGVEYHSDFASEKTSNHGKILCPCIDCHNVMKRICIFSSKEVEQPAQATDTSSQQSHHAIVGQPSQQGQHLKYNILLALQGEVT